MDLGALENDLRKEARKLPPKLLGILKILAEEFGKDLERIVSTMGPVLMPHIQAAMMEAAMETLDKEALNNSITKVLKELDENGA